MRHTTGDGPGVAVETETTAVWPWNGGAGLVSRCKWLLSVSSQSQGQNSWVPLRIFPRIRSWASTFVYSTETTSKKFRLLPLLESGSSAHFVRMTSIIVGHLKHVLIVIGMMLEPGSPNRSLHLPTHADPTRTGRSAPRLRRPSHFLRPAVLARWSTRRRGRWPMGTNQSSISFLLLVVRHLFLVAMHLFLATASTLRENEALSNEGFDRPQLRPGSVTKAFHRGRVNWSLSYLSALV